MNNNTNDSGFSFAKTLIKEVGQILKKGLVEGYQTSWKSDNTPVTNLDIEINKKIIEDIQKAFPGDKIYGEEESAGGDTGYTWVVDPIDGTQALGVIPASMCCIARVDDKGEPLFGLAYNPASDELFACSKGEKATLNDNELKVSDKSELKGSYVFFGSRMPEYVVSNGIAYDVLEKQGVKIFNARALMFGCMMVASGKVEGSVIGVKTPFEAATAKLIVEGAGGRVTDLLGEKTGRLDGDIKGLIVSNSLIHDALVQAFNK